MSIAAEVTVRLQNGLRAGSFRSKVRRTSRNPNLANLWGRNGLGAGSLRALKNRFHIGLKSS